VKTVWSMGTQYTVTGGKSGSLPATGTVTVDPSYSLVTGEKLLIERVTAQTQETVHNSNDAFPPKTVEGAYDHATLLAQEAAFAAKRGLKQGIVDYLANGELEIPAPEGGKVLGWNADGDGFENYDNPAVAEATAVAAAATATQKAADASQDAAAAAAAKDVAVAAAATLAPWTAKTPPSGDVVGTSDTQILTNKTLTSPAINSPTGITKSDVGLANVDDTSDATKDAATTTLTNKTLASPKISGVVLQGTSTDPELLTYPSQYQQEFTITSGNVGSAGAVIHDVSINDDTTDKDNGAVRGIIRQKNSGNSHIRAGEFHTVRSQGDGTKHTWALELGVHSQIAPGDSKQGAGIYLYNNHNGWLPSGQRAGSALLIEGEDGWTNFLEFRDTNSTTVLFKVDQYGAVSGANIRETLVADRTYYVRADGSNSNTGLVDSAGGALLTIPAALNKVAKLDFNGKKVTVKVGTGTYTSAITIPVTVGQVNIDDLIIEGDTTTPSNCDTSFAGFVVTCPVGARAKFRGFKVSGGATSQPLLFASGAGAYLQYDLIEFGTAVAEHVAAYGNGITERRGNCTISGNATSHARAYAGGVNLCQTGTGTLSGTPAFSSSFVRAGECGVVRTSSAVWSGAATGAKFLADTGGGIQAFTGSASLPGATAGTATSPGWVA